MESIMLISRADLPGGRRLVLLQGPAGRMDTARYALFWSRLLLGRGSTVFSRDTDLYWDNRGLD